MEVIDKVKRAIPTNRHAELLFDSTLSQLGERAFVVSADEGRQRTIYRREDPGSLWVVPSPLMKLTLGRRGSFVGVPGDITDRVPEESDAAPSRLRNLQGGEIEILGDEGDFCVTYAEDGQACETSRSGDETVTMLARAIEAGGGNPAELLARAVASRDTTAEAPGRVRFHEGGSVGLAGAWRIGLAAMRRALFAGNKTPAWIAADGYAGEALGFGPTRDEAVNACRSQIEILKPSLPEPKPMPELTPEFIEEMGGGDLQMISAPAEDRTIEPATPQNTPISLTRVGAPAVHVAGDGRDVSLLDERGRSFGATAIEEENGLTVIGHGVRERIDLEHLEARIDVAISAWEERRGPESPWPSSLPPLRSKIWVLDLAPDGDLSVGSSSATATFDAGALDGVRLHTRVLRQVRQRD